MWKINNYATFETGRNSHKLEITSLNKVVNFSGFDTPIPNVGSFIELSIGNFYQILTRPPNHLWMAPKSKNFIQKNPKKWFQS